MTQDEIMRMAREAGLQPYYDEQVTAIARFAAIVAATEREKCTNTQEFVTLLREVVEQALDAFVKLQADDDIGLASWDFAEAGNACFALRTALEQPQNHVPDAGNMVPAGWKLVPVEPNRAMLKEAQSASECCGDFDDRTDEEWSEWIGLIWDVMLAAAPQPPITEESSVVQPQANQPAMTPIAQRKLEDLMASGYTISGYSVYHERKHQHGFVTGAGLVGWWRPEGMEYPQPQGEQEPVAGVVIRDGLSCLLQDRHIKHTDQRLYTHPQPKREPLTIDEINKCFLDSDGTWEGAARAIEHAHGIGQEGGAA